METVGQKSVEINTLGQRVIGLDRVELDAWGHEYKAAPCRPCKPVDNLQPLAGGTGAPSRVSALTFSRVTSARRVASSYSLVSLSTYAPIG